MARVRLVGLLAAGDSVLSLFGGNPGMSAISDTAFLLLLPGEDPPPLLVLLFESPKLFRLVVGELVEKFIENLGRLGKLGSTLGIGINSSLAVS